MNNKQKNSSYERQLAGTVLVGCVAAFTAVIYVLLKKDEWAVGLLRYFVVVVFTVLPASLYYVFIASRKSSLFQEYVVNLNRLGLLRCDIKSGHPTVPDEGENYINQMRIQSYILRFEGVYGPIDKSLADKLQEAAVSGSPVTSAPPVIGNLATGPVFSFSTAVPVMLATFLIGVCWLIVLPPWTTVASSAPGSSPSLQEVLKINEYVPLLGFLGAYFFSLQMLFRRFVTNDLRARSYASVSMRIVMAVIGAWILQFLMDQEMFGIDINSAWILVLAFVIGAFPPVLWRLIREAGSNFPKVKTVIPSMDSRLPVSELDGLTIWPQARLEEEDVENSYNMANADIVDLLVQTKIPPERIIDWVDQAILFSTTSSQDEQHYKSIKNALSAWGIRSASMLEAAVHAKEPDSDGQLQRKIAGSIEYDKALSLTRTLNGFTNYALVKHWKGLSVVAENVTE